MGKEGGIFPTIVGTVALPAGPSSSPTPLGIATAIYLTEYTREGPVTRVIRFGAECLAGIPSIIFGLFGFVLFVTKLKFGWSILSGGLTLAFMILPTIIRTSRGGHQERAPGPTAKSASPWAARSGRPSPGSSCPRPCRASSRASS